ncbi:exoribonuclease family protein [Pyrenochaeta sp. DS3sAY3a]|nr:exoribonuclease family protein [Pyrenochaeta sp. DS3sAY3a]
MATTAPAAPPALTFPRPIFAAVSPHPFLQAHLSAGDSTSKTAIRANGRETQDFRILGINTGSLTHCNGSAVVRMGNTSVVCGVRAEILNEADTPGTPLSSQQLRQSTQQDTTDAESEEEDLEETDEIASLRLLVPNVELATGSTPAHIPGNAPTTFAQTLITRIRSLLISTRLLRTADLRILYTPPSNAEDPDAEPETSVKGYWVLYLDVFFISIDGNAFDSAVLSILAALRDTRLPRAYFDDEYEGILCSDVPGEARTLRLRGLPVSSSFAVFEGLRGEEGEDASVEWVLSDPDAFEEGVCRETVTVVVDGSFGGKGAKDVVVRRIEKSGGAVVDREVMRALVERAIERWELVRRVISATP